MNLVGLRRLNELRFADDPVAMDVLREWCRRGRLPAHQIGRQWRVDLDAFDGRVDPESRPSDKWDAKAAARALFGSAASG